LLAVEGFVCDPGMVIEAPGSWILLLKSRTSDATNLVIPWKIILVNSIVHWLAGKKKKCARLSLSVSGRLLFQNVPPIAIATLGPNLDSRQIKVRNIHCYSSNISGCAGHSLQSWS